MNAVWRQLKCFRISHLSSPFRFSCVCQKELHDEVVYKVTSRGRRLVLVLKVPAGDSFSLKSSRVVTGSRVCP